MPSLLTPLPLPSCLAAYVTGANLGLKRDAVIQTSVAALPLSVEKLRTAGPLEELEELMKDRRVLRSAGVAAQMIRVVQARAVSTAGDAVKPIERAGHLRWVIARVAAGALAVLAHRRGKLKKLVRLHSGGRPRWAWILVRLRVWGWDGRVSVSMRPVVFSTYLGKAVTLCGLAAGREFFTFWGWPFWPPPGDAP